DNHGLAISELHLEAKDCAGAGVLPLRAPECQLKVLKEKQGTLGDICPMQVGSPVHQSRGSSRHSGLGEHRDLSEGRGWREETRAGSCPAGPHLAHLSGAEAGSPSGHAVHVCPCCS
uniref:Uncharacterized protein n=1 Tax=Geospiza parvula TaxID=87175 RepID=A0A8C3M4K2_GEOPR